MVTVTSLVFRLKNERPYLVEALNLMILHAVFDGFCGWKLRISSNVGGANCQNLWFSWKLQFLAENCRFWPKTADFSWKPRLSRVKLFSFHENHGFWPKTVDFAASEFKTTKLFISFQSREGIQKVSKVFSFGGGVKSVDLIIKCV